MNQQQDFLESFSALQNQVKRIEDTVYAAHTKIVDLDNKRKKRVIEIILESSAVGALVATLLSVCFQFIFIEKEIKKINDISDKETIKNVITSVDNVEKFREIMLQLCLGMSDKNTGSKLYCDSLNRLIQIKEGATILMGTVYDLESNNPISDVTVLNSFNTSESKTNDNGIFRFDFDADSDIDIELTFHKSGYKKDSTSFKISKNKFNQIMYAINKNM